MKLSRAWLWVIVPLLVCASAVAGLVQFRERLAQRYLAEGRVLLQQGELREALGDFTWAILLMPGHDAPYAARAQAYQALHLAPQAVADLDAALRIAPRQASLLYQRGLLHAKPLEQYRRAIRDFDAVVRLEPGNALAYYQRGHAYDLINNPHQAVKDYTRALALRPDLADALRERSHLYGRMRDLPHQIADLSALLRLNPGELPVREQRARALLAQRRFAEALADLEQVLRQDPRTPVHFQRGTAHLNLGHYRAAIADFTAVVRGNRFRVAAYYNRARAYEALGMTERAHADWAAVCELQVAGQSEACYLVERRPAHQRQASLP